MLREFTSGFLLYSYRGFGCAYWPRLCPYNSQTLSFRSKQCGSLAIVHITKVTNAWMFCDRTPPPLESQGLSPKILFGFFSMNRDVGNTTQSIQHHDV
jgi:hypothetical protein